MFSVAVMAHPSRAHRIPHLQSVLGDIPILIDTDGLGVWGNARRAWKAHDDRPYHLVVQDDATLCHDFLAKAQAFRLDHPDGLVSYYYGSRRRYLAQLTQENIAQGYIRMPARTAWPMGLALCAPTVHIDRMVAAGDRMRTVATIGDDIRIFRYFATLGANVWYTLPSLVNHLDLPSIIGHRPDMAALYADQIPRGVSS